MTGSSVAGIITAVATCLIAVGGRSEEHTSELQSRLHVVCRLLLEIRRRRREAQMPMMPAPKSVTDQGSGTPVSGVPLPIVHPVQDRRHTESSSNMKSVPSLESGVA